MKNFLWLILPAVGLVLAGCGQQSAPQTNDNAAPTASDQAPAAATATPVDFSANPVLATTTGKQLLAKYTAAVLRTNFGDITVKFYPQDAPQTITNFIKLSLVGFYDKVKFHRVIKDFMIQSGDPNSKDDNWSDDGLGGPGYTVPDEINTRKLVLGSVAMANQGQPDTGGSQFFIVTVSSTPWLDGRYTNFGEVTAGLEAVKKIGNLPTNENDHPTQDVIINSVELLP